ncbi:HAD hydrolase-like protein [Candidatus Woesearchaeota archaeon]|nr:HAD hydrolase-like protein [Candidatus Woesearchaeota archaeon]
MHKGAILDFDGTLWDSSFYEKRVVENAVSAMRMTGLPALSQNEAVSRLMEIRRKDPNAPDHFDQLCHAYALGEKESGRIVRTGINTYHAIRDGLFVPQPETDSFLDFLVDEGFKSCVITRGIRQKQIDKLNRLGILRYFSADGEDGSFVYVLENAADKVVGKRNLALEAIADLGLDPSLSFVLDDRPYGIVAAKMAGVKYGIRVKQGKYADEDYGEIDEQFREDAAVSNLWEAANAVKKLIIPERVLRVVQ